MLIETNCEKRGCKHYLGIKNETEDELNERQYCEAFPDEIPEDIAYGDNLHLKPVSGQGNDVVFSTI